MNQEKEFINTIETYQQIIYKVCYMYASGHTSLNDLYQEVVINLWKAYPKFRGECKISTWIYRIGLNTCITFYRKGNSLPEVVPFPEGYDVVWKDENEQAYQLREMYRLINNLSSIEKALILLWLEEKSYQEIAEITGVSKGNVAVKLNRIKEKLKNMSNL
ncbi:MAG: sigma-70 family RNA polymerase sigma factor [Tannerellaceae bacterium]|nr:sigma-70 family RNA polymerase sigma factor [Tannerellaceae bacterium]